MAALKTAFLIHDAGAEYYMGQRLSFLSPARPINADWQGLQDNIDTAVYLEGSIIFFKVGTTVQSRDLYNEKVRFLYATL